MTKILIVDDEPDILEFLQYNLEKEGFEVSVANDGEEGLIKAHSSVPDLIVLDIMMPRMDGFEVCKELRKDPKFDQTIITFLTAKDEDYSQIAALDLGGDDFITKPVSPRVFTSRIKALLRRKKSSDSNIPDGLNNISGTIDESLTRLGIGQGQFKVGNDFLSSIIGPTETLQKYADDGRVVDRKLRSNGWFSNLFGIKI